MYVPTVKTHKPKEQYNTAMYTHTHGYFLHFFAPLPLPTHQEKATTATHTHKTTKQKHQSRLLAWATTSNNKFQLGASFTCIFIVKKSPSSVAKYHWWELLQVSFLSWQNTSFVVTKVGLPQQNFCHTKIVFVVTKVSLSRQNFWCDKIMFVVTKDVFVMTKLLSWQNDTCGSSCQWEQRRSKALSAAWSGAAMAAHNHRDWHLQWPRISNQ